MQKLETAQQLQQRIRVILETVDREFRPLTDEHLNWKPSTRRWSMTQCLQHLNLAERFYIRNLQKKVDDLGLIQTLPADQTLQSDWVGKLLRRTVDPASALKLPTLSFMKPRHDLNAREVLNQFVDLQQLLHDLLDKVIFLDWNQTRLMTLFGNWLKINVGDAVQMLVAHTERHLNQALRVKQEATGFLAK